MRRRAFITLLRGAAAAWPVAAVAQVSTKRPLIAWLSLGERTASWAVVEAFLHGMRDFGYTDGDNFEFAPRFADGYIERLPMLAQELVRLRPDVILAPASGPAVAAKRATATIPIVSPALADAVHLGLVGSVSRPAGNVTGITPYVEGLPAKQMELAREVVPGAARIGILSNAGRPPHRRDGRASNLDATQRAPKNCIARRHRAAAFWIGDGPSVPCGDIARSNKGCNPPYHLGLGQEWRVTLIRHDDDFELTTACQHRIQLRADHGVPASHSQ